MLDFVFILLIIFEILFTYICVNKIIELDKKVIELDKKMDEIYKKILEINKTVKDILKKINKVVSIFTNQKFILIRRIIVMTLDVIEIIILIRTLDFSKGKKFFNAKNLRKILFAKITREFLTKLVTNA